MELARPRKEGTPTPMPPNKEETPVLTNPLAIIHVEGMVWIPAGTFMMGSPESEPGNSPMETQHQVTLTKGFYMGKYPVTQAQYQEVMGKTIVQQQALASFPKTTDFGRGDDYPMYYVSWYDALAFCNKLSMMEGLSPAYRISGSTDPDGWGTVPTSESETWNVVYIITDSNGYRLPTEAQWEYACRAGTTAAYNTGDTISDDTGWYKDNSDGRTHELGLKTPNAWGLYDMHGNVLELCWDWYGYDIYWDGAQTDPVGTRPYMGDFRVARGGSWTESGQSLRSAYRGYDRTYYRSEYTGFRVVRP
jgi:formylglycine-generating enzyme required for sulfatase activity